jgi:hypothetical protein
MVSRPRIDALILGTCRAALHFDSKKIAAKTGLEIFNAARVVDGIGNIELTWNIAKAHHIPKYVFLVFDDGMWTQPRKEAAEDLERHRLEWVKMDEDAQAIMADEYHFESYLLKSGFLKFRGMGEELLRTVRRSFSRSSAEPLTDGYFPRPPGQNIIAEIDDPSQLKLLETRQIKKLALQKFSVETIERIVRDIKTSGSTPVFITSPMHRYRASDEVVREELKLIYQLAETYDVKLFNYLGNKSEISNRDELWSDSGHMNQLGAEKISLRFSRDWLDHLKLRGEN